MWLFANDRHRRGRWKNNVGEWPSYPCWLLKYRTIKKCHPPLHSDKVPTSNFQVFISNIYFEYSALYVCKVPNQETFWWDGQLYETLLCLCPHHQYFKRIWYFWLFLFWGCLFFGIIFIFASFLVFLGQKFCKTCLYNTPYQNVSIYNDNILT